MNGKVFDMFVVVGTLLHWVSSGTLWYWKETDVSSSQWEQMQNTKVYESLVKDKCKILNT